MQCQQPLFGISLPGPGQYFPSNPVNPFSGLAPDVIGEGEVNSITFPDGSIQYYFLPVRWQSDIFLKRWPPYPFNDNMFCNYSKPNPGVWIIRNFSNTISPVYNQYWQRTNLDPFTKPCFGYDCNVMPAGFQLKFHNDCWTSTTDLHCFCPYIPPAPAIATICTAAQVDTPTETKPCCPTTDYKDPNKNPECILKIMKECNNIINRCKCTMLEKDVSSRMSIDKSKTSSSSLKTSPCSSNSSLNKSKSRKTKHKKPSSTRSIKREPKKNEIFCECDANKSKKKYSEKHSQPREKHSQLCEKHSQLYEKHCQLTETESKCIGDDFEQDKEDKGEIRAQKFGQKSTRVNFVCEDKIVATYNQASSVTEAEGQTQTECSCWSMTDMKAPKTSRRLRSQYGRKSASTEKLFGVYELSSSESYCTMCKCDTSRESLN